MKGKAAAMLMVAFALPACDRQSGSAAPEGATTAAPAASAQRSGGDAVPAVLQSSGSPVARLSFIIDAKPVAGQPFTVKLQASAATSVQELEVLVSAPELIVAPETAKVTIEKPDAPAFHELIVTAPQPGLTELNVRLKAGAGPEALYAIPVLVAAADG